MDEPNPRTNDRADWIDVSVDDFPARLPPTVVTVQDIRDALELPPDREIVRLVEGDEEIYPGQKRLGVDRLGDPDDPVVVSEGDAFLTRERDDEDTRTRDYDVDDRAAHIRLRVDGEEFTDVVREAELFHPNRLPDDVEIYVEQIDAFDKTGGDGPDPVPREAVAEVVDTLRDLAEANRVRWEETDGEFGDLSAGSAYEDAANHVEQELLGRWTGPDDPRTADAADWIADSATVSPPDGDEFHVLRDMELQSVSLVPPEDVEGFGGGRVDLSRGSRTYSGTISVDVEDVDEEELQRFREAFEEADAGESRVVDEDDRDDEEEEEEDLRRLREWADRREEEGDEDGAEYLRDLADAAEALRRNSPDREWRW